MTIHKRFMLVTALAMMTAFSGCATNEMQRAQQEERAAQELRTAGARDAARAAESRADTHRRNASCDGFLDCVFSVLLSIE